MAVEMLLNLDMDVLLENFAGNHEKSDGMVVSNSPQIVNLPDLN